MVAASCGKLFSSQDPIWDGSIQVRPNGQWSEYPFPPSLIFRVKTPLQLLKVATEPPPCVPQNLLPIELMHQKV